MLQLNFFLTHPRTHLFFGRGFTLYGRMALRLALSAIVRLRAPSSSPLLLSRQSSNCVPVDDVLSGLTPEQIQVMRCYRGVK